MYCHCWYKNYACEAAGNTKESIANGGADGSVVIRLVLVVTVVMVV